MHSKLSLSFCTRDSGLWRFKQDSTTIPQIFSNINFHFSLFFLPSATCFLPTRTPATRTPSPFPTTLSAAGSAVCITTTACMCGTWERWTPPSRCIPPSSTPPASGTSRWTHRHSPCFYLLCFFKDFHQCDVITFDVSLNYNERGEWTGS